MKKLCKLSLCLTIMFSSLVALESPIVMPIEVQADVTSLGCGTQYEVSVANSNGSFSKKSCHNSFSDAQNTMWGYGDDAVVRHSSSKSPMKIIAMSSGLAITYPMRSNSSTMDITQIHSSSNRKVTYVTKHREMKYDGTDSYNGSGNGTIRVNITGFSGTTDLVNVDLVPFPFLGNNVTVLLGGNDTSAANEQPFWTHIYQTHYTVSQNGGNKELTYVAHSGWSNDTWPAKYAMTVGLAADWMTVGTTYYSYDGYNFYSDYKYKNKVGTYYNYYQFLPTRTKSNIPASVFDSYLTSVKGSGTNSKMKNQGQTFINAQNTYGMNALLIYALACLESAYGTSNFAMDRNNLFGWNAFDSSPGSAASFLSIEVAVNEHMGINLRGYTNIEDYRFFGSHVGNKGSGFNVKYAADPYWGYKIAGIAYSIDKVAGFADLNKYSVGVINSYGVNVLKSPGGAKLFNSAYGATYQENFTVAVLGNESNHYKIQSTNPLSVGNIVTDTTKGLVNYDWNNSVGYIATGYVTMTGNSAPSTEGTVPSGDAVKTISKFVVSGTDLIIEGSAYQPGIYITNDNKITQTLRMYDRFFETTDFAMTTTTAEKDKATFVGKVNLSTLSEGKYYFEVSSNYSKYTDYNQLFNATGVGLTLPNKSEIDGKIFEFTLDNDVIFVNVSKSQVTPQPTPSPTPSPTESPDTQVTELYQSVSSVEYVSENSVKISGQAFITLIDASDTSTVTHKLELVNLDDKTKKLEIITNTLESDGNVDLADGYKYKKIKYESLLDLNTVTPGNYYFQMTVTNGETAKSGIIYTNLKTVDSREVDINGYKTKLLRNPNSNYRFEVVSEKSELNLTSILKPTTRGSVIGFDKITINNDQLEIDGYAFIYNAYMNPENNPKFKVILMGNQGNVISFEATTKACSIDLALLRNSIFKISNACFSFNQDISTLSDDNYRVYIDVATNEYHDIYEMYDSRFKVSTFSSDTKDYAIKKSSIRSRLEVSITTK